MAALTGEKAKTYGLIIPSKTKQTGGARNKNIFGDDNSDEETEKVNVAKKRTNTNTNVLKRQTQLVVEKALDEDPNIFDYDGAYETMQREKEEKVMAAKQKDKERKPKYMQALLKAASRRNLEREKREDVKIQAERRAEGEKYADKEKFVTAAYREKMLALQAAEEEERRQEAVEAAYDVKKQRDLSMFYRHILNDTTTTSTTTAVKQEDDGGGGTGHTVRVKEEEGEESTGRSRDEIEEKVVERKRSGSENTDVEVRKRSRSEERKRRSRSHSKERRRRRSRSHSKERRSHSREKRKRSRHDDREHERRHRSRSKEREKIKERSDGREERSHATVSSPAKPRTTADDNKPEEMRDDEKATAPSQEVLDLAELKRRREEQEEKVFREKAEKLKRRNVNERSVETARERYLARKQARDTRQMVFHGGDNDDDDDD